MSAAFPVKPMAPRQTPVSSHQAKQISGGTPVKFGATLPKAAVSKAVASKAPLSVGSRILENLDFTSVGTSPVKQIGLIFSSLITWRLLAANERRRASVSKRWNELRENLLRDLLGFGFWFLGVPVLQRFYLAGVARRKPELNNVLIRKLPPETRSSQGWMNWLKTNNPLSNSYIPSTEQVKDQMHQALQELSHVGLDKNAPAYRQTKAAYEHFIKHRNFASALGLGSTIVLLGVGINLINFYLTRKNVSRGLTDAPVATSPVGTASTQGGGGGAQAPALPQGSVSAFPVPSYPVWATAAARQFTPSVANFQSIPSVTVPSPFQEAAQPGFQRQA